MGGTDSHAGRVTWGIRAGETAKREVMDITVEKAAEEEGNAIFDGTELRLFVQGNADRARGVDRNLISAVSAFTVQGGLLPDAPSSRRQQPLIG